MSAQRAVAWSEVARRLAHEIKNPLTPIQLSAERMQLKLADQLPPAEAEMLSRSSQTLEKFGTSGTPSFYVNGRFAGGQDFAAFKKMIDEEIKKADASGVKPADYYDKVVVGKGEQQAKMISPFDE